MNQTKDRIPQGARALHLQVQQVRKGREETDIAELGSASQIEEQEEYAQAVETGTGIVRRV